MVSEASEQKIKKWFWMFTGINAFLWTALPCAVLPGMPVDTPELLYWARHLQGGYPKHPPMTYWTAFLFDRLAGGRLWGQYFAAQALLFLVYWAVWRLALKFLDASSALVSVMVLQAVYFYGFMSPEFNHNIVIIPFWAGTAYFFWEAAAAGKNRYWLLCGLAAGLGFLVKYSMLAVVFPLLLFLALHPKMRTRLLSPGPYLALAAASLVVLPHLLWLRGHQFSSIHYADGRLLAEKGMGARFYHPLEFAVIQLAAILPAILLLYFSARPPKTGNEKKEGGSLAGVYLFTVALGPFLTHAAVSLLFGVKMKVNMYGSPLWIFGGAGALFYLKQKGGTLNLKTFIGSFLPVYFFWIFVFAAQYLALPYWTHRPKRGHFPGAEVARILEKKYGSALPAVAGDPWIAGNVSIYSPSGPPVFTDSAYEFVDMRKHIEELSREGAVLVWDVNKERDGGDICPQRYREIFPELHVQPVIYVKWLTGAPLPSAAVGWAILGPRGAEQRAS